MSEVREIDLPWIAMWFDEVDDVSWLVQSTVSLPIDRRAATGGKLQHRLRMLRENIHSPRMVLRKPEDHDRLMEMLDEEVDRATVELLTVCLAVAPDRAEAMVRRLPRR